MIKQVPQELQEQIVNLYDNKKYGIMKIKKQLNLDFGERTIKTILRNHGVHIRNYSESMQSRKQSLPDISKEIEQQIIEKYNEGYGLERIIKDLDLHFTPDKLKNILIKNNIHVRNMIEGKQVAILPDLRKYSLNDDYVLESHNGAWLLGFFAADGYLPITKGAKNKLVLTLQRADEDILERISNELQYEGKIYQFYSSNGFPQSSLSFTSKKLREQFENYGIVNAKTFKLKHLPNLPKEYMIDFIRGFFDGDGSLYEIQKEKKINMSICSACKTFLEEISSFLNKEYGFNIPTITEDHRQEHINYSIRYYKYDSLRLGDIFYNNEYLALPRKKNFFFELKNKYNK